MRASTVAQRYARAFLEIGIDRAEVARLGEELAGLAGLFEAPELRELLRNPKFNTQARKRVLSTLIEGVSPITRSFVSLLADRNRVKYLPEIAAAYQTLADEQAGQVRAKITTARALNDAQLGRLSAALSQQTDREVSLEQRVDPEILGGLIARVGDRVYDGSLRAQLNNLKRQLSSVN
ncbi:ATP synthase F1 subunit delta [Myxococcota bacterium]|nr:ATP synthase F1 subunit delta [Myxococcota bacterium]MBU1431510.1 ATP synthase F1 subunit delta [Myxococcota bacterium]MBU1898163.1 ATP synthase F1 subunit delta [Myxococcota bacterium]